MSAGLFTGLNECKLVFASVKILFHIQRKRTDLLIDL